MKNLSVSRAPLKISEVGVFTIRVYQFFFSPDHGIFRGTFGFNRCRFFPSCSEYAILAIRQYGLFTGSVFAVKRILKCNPWNEGGYDPVKISNS